MIRFQRTRDGVRAARRLYGTYKFSILILVVLGFSSGFLDVLGVSALIPLFSFLVQGKVTDENRITHLFRWVFAGAHWNISVPSILALMVVLFILQAVFLFLFKYFGVKVVSQCEADMRKDLYRRSLALQWPYLLQQRVGYVENLLTVDVGRTLKLLRSSLGGVLSATSLLMYVGVALALSWRITLLALGVGFLVLALYRPLLNRTRVYAREILSLNKKIAHEINENASGLKVIKAMRVEEPLSDTVSSFFLASRAVKVKSGMIRAFSSASFTPLSVFFIAVLFDVMYRRPSFNFASFVVVLYLIQQIFGYVDRLQSALHEINEDFPFARHVALFQDALAVNRERRGGFRPFSFERDIEFVDVSFAYGTKPVLSRVSFRIPKGSMVGIVGPSGAGKTTIGDLLLRLFQPTAGVIRMDGQDVEGVSIAEWRQHIGYVSQELFLKNDTITQNIRFYDPRVTDARMREAARMANALEFIEQLPKGFESIVGERGVMLSAGQRQRIVLARVLARRPALLILDEATSALDNESEALIKQAIDRLRGEMTIVVIAHRLSTIMECDQVLVVSDAAIREQGTPRSLRDNPSSYFHRLHALGERSPETMSERSLE